MALLFTAPVCYLSPPSSSASHSFVRLCHRPISLHPKSRNHVGGIVHAPFTPINRSAVIVKASSNANGEDMEKSVPVENLPLESKVEAMNDQRVKMKLAKKIRLRRKRLVRKRHLRKKGRWPPSKVKKNKNV